MEATEAGQQKQLGQELIAKIPRDLQERDPLWRAEVWPQEKEHSGTPPHAFEIKPANCTAPGCAGRRGHPGVLGSTPLEKFLSGSEPT